MMHFGNHRDCRRSVFLVLARNLRRIEVLPQNPRGGGRLFDFSDNRRGARKQRLFQRPDGLRSFQGPTQRNCGQLLFCPFDLTEFHLQDLLQYRPLQDHGQLVSRCRQYHRNTPLKLTIDDLRLIRMNYLIVIRRSIRDLWD